MDWISSLGASPALKVLVITLLLSAATGSCSWAKPLRHDFPKVGKFEVLSGDFHMHTVISDGSLTVKQRVEEAAEYGYDVIAVTDHGKSRGYRVAKQTGEPLGLVVLCGFESGVNSQEHLNVIDVPAGLVPRSAHVLAENPGEKQTYYRDELKKVNAAGGFVIYNHPHVGYREPVLWGVKEGLIQGIEVKNGVVDKGWNTVFSHNSWCYPEAFTFALKHNLAIFANSDQHAPRNPAIRQWTTLVLAQDRTPEAVMEAIRDRRTIAWFDNMLWGREALLKSLITSSVKIQKYGDEAVVVVNHSPVALSTKFNGSAEPVAIPAYSSQTVVVKHDGKTLNMAWGNIWTSLTTNLSTDYQL